MKRKKIIFKEKNIELYEFLVVILFFYNVFFLKSLVIKLGKECLLIIVVGVYVDFWRVKGIKWLGIKKG